MTECTIDGCDRGGRIIRDMCKMHWTRWKRHGDPTYVVKPYSRGRTECDVDGCGRKHCGRGVCNSHLSRLNRYGDVFAHIPIGDHSAMRAATAPPPPDPETCVDCGAEPDGGMIRCWPCASADLARRRAGKPAGDSKARPSDERTCVRRVSLPPRTVRGAA